MIFAERNTNLRATLHSSLDFSCPCFGRRTAHGNALCDVTGSMNQSARCVSRSISLAVSLSFPACALHDLILDHFLEVNGLCQRWDRLHGIIVRHTAEMSILIEIWRRGTYTSQWILQVRFLFWILEAAIPVLIKSRLEKNLIKWKNL